MLVTRYSDQKWFKYAGQRGGKSEYLRLFSSPEYELTIARMTGPGNHSPRHRHDFDQIRYALKSNLEYAPDREIPEGCFAYFPEGTYYGPFTLDPDMQLLGLQFQGASRSRFVDYDTLRSAQQELGGKGEFKQGIYTWSDENGRKHNKDGHQAVMEHITGTPLKIPAPRYADPILIYPQNFNWRNAGTGAFYKEFGTFSERGTVIGMIRLEANGSYMVPSPERTTLLVVLSGSANVAGKSLVKQDAIRLDPGETLALTSPDGAELSLYGLPV